MRNLILFGALVSTACSFKFLENAQTYLSGNADASVSAGSSGSNFLSGLQNSSFGQAVMGGINTYNQAKNSSGGNWQTAVANSSVGNFFQNGIDFFNGMKNGTQNFLDTDTIQETIGNSSFGEVVQTGVEFFNNIKNGNSPFQGDASSVMSQFVPFLANASAEAKAEFYTILPNFGNMTIAEFETAVNAWAAKYNLTDEVEAFNERSKNATVVAEEHANVVVMNLPNVLNNLKAISSDKNQTVVEMHTRMMAYVNSLDDDTRDIVFIFFRNLLPPQFKKSKCVDQGNFLTNMYNKASDFFAGRNNRTDGGEGSFWSGQGQNGNSGGSGFSSFFNNFNGQGNGNGNGAQNPMIGMFNNFMKKNNITADEANAAMADGGASIQILPAISAGWGDVAQVKIGGDFKIAVEEETKTTKKNKKQQQQANKNKNKNKKKTTIAPEAAIDANIAAEVHTQVL